MTTNLIRALSHESLAWVHAMDADPFLGRLIRGESIREEYVLFLARTYHYVRWSGPILAETAEGLRRTGRYPWLARLLEEKTEEEAPHDAWALADLRALGVNVELVKARSPGAAVMAYVAWSRAMAEQGSPAFLGAAYALELISMHRAGAAARSLRARNIIPGIDAAVSFLEGHGEADVEHIETMNRLLDGIGDRRDRESILLSARVLFALYPQFFAGTCAPVIAPSPEARAVFEEAPGSAPRLVAWSEYDESLTSSAAVRADAH